MSKYAAGDCDDTEDEVMGYSVEMCVCDSDLCNSASIITISSASILLPLTMTQVSRLLIL